MQAYKPGSVSTRRRTLTIYLGLPSRTRSKQPTRQLTRAALISSSFLLESVGLFGLATSEVYLASAVTTGTVRSYRAFSPLPR